VPKGDGLSAAGAPKLKPELGVAAAAGGLAGASAAAVAVTVAAAGAAGAGAPVPKEKVGLAAVSAEPPPKPKAAGAGAGAEPKVKAGAEEAGAAAGVAAVPKEKAAGVAAGVADAPKEKAPPGPAAAEGRPDPATSWTLANGFGGAPPPLAGAVGRPPALAAGRFARRILRSRSTDCRGHTGARGQREDTSAPLGRQVVQCKRAHLVRLLEGAWIGLSALAIFVRPVILGQLVPGRALAGHGGFRDLGRVQQRVDGDSKKRRDASTRGQGGFERRFLRIVPITTAGSSNGDLHFLDFHGPLRALMGMLSGPD